MQPNATDLEDDWVVTVCDRCLRASCWHGDDLCEDARDAGTTLLCASELRELALEHPDYYSRAELARVTGNAGYMETDDGC